jgi:hypothetical protein
MLNLCASDLSIVPVLDSRNFVVLDSNFDFVERIHADSLRHAVHIVQADYPDSYTVIPLACVHDIFAHA